MTEPSDIQRITVHHPRLDAAAAPAFRQELDEGIQPGQSRILLDLDAVDFIDSTGLGVLVSLLKRMGPDGRLAVIGAKPAVARLFQITRLDSLFKLCGDVHEARRTLGA